MGTMRQVWVYEYVLRPAKDNQHQSVAASPDKHHTLLLQHQWKHHKLLKPSHTLLLQHLQRPHRLLPQIHAICCIPMLLQSESLQEATHQLPNMRAKDETMIGTISVHTVAALFTCHSSTVAAMYSASQHTHCKAICQRCALMA